MRSNEKNTLFITAIEVTFPVFRPPVPKSLDRVLRAVDRRVYMPAATKTIQIISDPPAAPVDVNDDYVGDAPISITVRISNGI